MLVFVGGQISSRNPRGDKSQNHDFAIALMLMRVPTSGRRLAPTRFRQLGDPAPSQVSQPKFALRATRYPLQEGDAGIARTVRYMIAMVEGNEGAANPEIRRAAIDITRNVASRDSAGEINAIQQWVQKNIRFRGEFKETIQSPLATLKLEAGDCDDQAQLVAALLKSIGHKTRFRTIAVDRTAPDQFSHVYTEVLDRTTGQWVPVETTIPGVRAGWAPQRVFRSQAWRTMGRTMGEIRSNAMYQANLGKGAALAARTPRRFMRRGMHGLACSGCPTNRALEGLGFDWGSLFGSDSLFKPLVQGLAVRIGGGSGGSYQATAQGSQLVTFPPGAAPTSSIFAPTAYGPAFAQTPISGTTLLVAGGIGLGLILLLSRR